MTRGMTSRIAILGVMLCQTASLLGCSGSKQDVGAKSESRSQPAAPIEVSTASVIERNLRRALEVVGSLDAQEQVTLSSQASGVLEEITVDVGTAVTRGQVVARIDSRDLKLRVEQAEAALRQAEAKLGLKSGEKFDPERQPDVRAAKAGMERARYDWKAAQDLVEHGDVSKQTYDMAQKAFEQAEARYQAALENVRNLEASAEEKRAALALAKKQFEDAAVVSPINGVVKEKSASRGEYLQPGKPVATIVQVNPLRLKIEVPESFATGIKRGQRVTLKVDSYPDREFSGQISRISPSIDEKNRSLVAEAEVRNEGGLLKPGMFARVQVTADEAGAALMVPEKSVVSLAGVNKVFVVDNGRAVERKVKLGTRDGGMIEVVEGVKSGERVITSNTDKLADGSAVSAAQA